MSTIRKVLLVTFFSIVLVACQEPSTSGSGFEQGTDTGSFAGNYEGTLELELTANATGHDTLSDSGLVSVEIDITGDGIVHLTIDNYTVDGVIDNAGDWKLEIDINEFSDLIDEEHKDILKQAGCPLDKPFVKIEGEVTPPDMSGDVSGKLSCKVLFRKIASMEFAGTLTASI